MAERNTMSPELQLLFSCARGRLSEDDETQIRSILDAGVDWTAFVQLATDNRLEGLAGHTLARVAPEALPGDIREAFRLNLDRTRGRNRTLLQELQRVLARLASDGIVAIPIRGPITAIQAYGDLGVRSFHDLELLVRDCDIARTIVALEDLEYERMEHLTDAQNSILQRLRGHVQFSSKAAGGVALKVHTRLAPMSMALDIDYPGLWQRAQRKTLNGQELTILAPEDYLLILAISGAKDLWLRLTSICDVAVFAGAHPKLDWNTVIARAEAQRCLRVAVGAMLFAHKFFNAAIPPLVAARHWPGQERIIRRAAAVWSGDETAASRSTTSISLDRLRLQDGIVRQGFYLAGAMLLPKPRHVAWIALPEWFSVGYVPLRFIHDAVWMPLLGVQRALARRLAQPRVAAWFSSRLRAERRVHKQARAEALSAIETDASDVEAWYNLGNAFSGLEQYEEAIASYDKGLALVPENAGIWRNRGAAIKALKNRDGVCTIPEVPPIHPEDAVSLTIRAGFLWSSRRFHEAIEMADQALKIDPEHGAASRIAIAARIYACDWRSREDDKELIRKRLEAGKRLVTPFSHRSIIDSEEEHLILARLRSEECPETGNLWRDERYLHDKIRIAYISSDFRGHVVGRVIADCFERHDKARFETIAISHGKDDGSPTRKRLEAAFDRFVDAQKISDKAAARLLRDLEIDIAVDLAGYTQGGRNKILAMRPAPVQVNWLGYPGTMGSSSMDYILANRIMIPPENQIHYAENVVYLPHSYLPHDSKRAIPEVKSTRAEVGLPENGFVFACMNDTHKITPEVFDIWMRLLRAVEGSVLWLRSANSGAMINLRREAEFRGISGERLLYAPYVKDAEEYVARLGLADLFLDTLPYNAHATAMDALWAGLPVLTRPGNTFPGRVAASLLNALGMPELVTSSPAEYEQTALAFARDPEGLARLKAKLLRNRQTEPLFDTARFTRDLEKAYTMMWERAQKGEPPVSFAVPAD